MGSGLTRRTTSPLQPGTWTESRLLRPSSQVETKSPHWYITPGHGTAIDGTTTHGSTPELVNINRIYGLTEAAAEWVNNGIRIEWRRAQPGLFGYYPGGYIRVGHTDLESIMHEVMHAFWPHWNGFPEPCDQMNIYTFRSDAAQFVLDFREHDRSETPNPWEPVASLLRLDGAIVGKRNAGRRKLLGHSRTARFS